MRPRLPFLIHELYACPLRPVVAIILRDKSDKYSLAGQYYLLSGSRQVELWRVQLSDPQEVTIIIYVGVADLKLIVAQ